MMGTGSLISGFLLSYTGWQAVNYTGVGHDFPRFIVMKSPEKILKVAPGHMSGNPGWKVSVCSWAEHYTNDAWWSVWHSNIICPEVKISTRGRSQSVDILTEGHIILECRTMNIMHHMFCRMTNCDKKLSANENKHMMNQLPDEITSTPINILRYYSKKNSKYVTDIIFFTFHSKFS